ncbi:MAG: DUF1636 family protein [Pseudooceanicola sp.]|nr:DUF1636 family protein [Pseudooceanicola sp.]
MSSLRLLVCSTCLRETSTATEECARARAALNAAGIAAQVAEFACLGGCDTPVSIGIQSEGRASYVFSDLGPDWPEGDLAAFCRLYLDAPNGWIEDARPAGQLRFHLRARLPAPPSAPEGD